jgi:hypothetical protein
MASLHLIDVVTESVTKGTIFVDITKLVVGMMKTVVLDFIAREM